MDRKLVLKIQKGELTEHKIKNNCGRLNEMAVLYKTLGISHAYK